MRIPIALLLLAPALLLAGCDKASVPPEQAPDKAAALPAPAGKKEDFGLVSSSGMTATLTYKFAGQQAPNANFTGADGRDVTLADFAGRPLLVNLWATWCVPCVKEMPTLDALASLEEGRVTVVAVSQDLKGRTPVRAFFDKAKIANLEPYTDPDNAMLAAFGNSIPLPTTILYDSDGREIWRVIGGVEWDDEEVAKLLREAA